MSEYFLGQDKHILQSICWAHVGLKLIFFYLSLCMCFCNTNLYFKNHYYTSDIQFRTYFNASNRMLENYLKQYLVIFQNTLKHFAVQLHKIEGPVDNIYICKFRCKHHIIVSSTTPNSIKSIRNQPIYDYFINQVK